MRVRAWPDPTPPQTGDHCRNWWANLLQSTEPPNLAADLKATTLDPAIAAMAAPKSLEEEWEAKDSAARNETQSKRKLCVFWFYKAKRKMLVFCFGSSGESDGVGDGNEVVGGLFELELTDQICGAFFWVNYHVPQFEINCLCDNCSFGVGVKWSYCVGFCWGFEVFWVEN